MLPPETPDSPLRNTQEVAMLLGDSINQVRRGQLDPRVANAMGYLAGILLRALEQGPIEERLTRVEASLGLTSIAPQNFQTRGARTHVDEITTESN